MAKDSIYSEKQETIKPFEFNESVVNVFDDMIHRSVPLYRETVKRQAQLACKFFQPGTRIYDLGCSNGNFGMRLLGEMGRQPFEMLAVDNSEPMLETYKRRLDNHPAGEQISLLCRNIQEIDLDRASVVIINLTLQFLPMEDRDALIQKIYDSLLPSGILLITEKVVHENCEFSELQQEFYYRFKKENGYSNLEISQKRDALENVLRPETVEVHTHRFKKTGFKKIDIWQKWFNFASFICQKQ